MRGRTSVARHNLESDAVFGVPLQATQTTGSDNTDNWLRQHKQLVQTTHPTGSDNTADWLKAPS